MFEILVYLYESYRHADLTPDRDALEERLFAAGFEENEIERALDWFTRMSVSPCHPRLMEAGYRHFAPEEAKRLNLECLSTLRYLEQAQILDAESREWVIHGLLSLGGDDIDADQVRWMTLIVLWSRGFIEHYTFLEDLLINPTDYPLH
jgi:Smg protein